MVSCKKAPAWPLPLSSNRLIFEDCRHAPQDPQLRGQAYKITLYLKSDSYFSYIEICWWTLPIKATARLIFTSDGVGVRVRVVIRSIGVNNLVKTAFCFHLRLHHSWSSENWVVGVTSRSRRTKSITKHGNLHWDWFILRLLLPTPTIWFSLDCKQWSCKQSQTKMEMFWFF